MLHIICDIDRTISNNDHRAYLVECDEPNWDAFLEPHLVAQDLPIKLAQDGLKFLLDIGAKVTFLTGRNESLREVTAEWIKKHFNIEVNDKNLLMRSLDDRSVPSKFKKEKLTNFIEETVNFNDIVVCFDDDIYALNMYNELGLIAFKAPGCWDSFHSVFLPLNKEGFWRR